MAVTRLRAAEAECALNGLKYLKDHPQAFEHDSDDDIDADVFALEMERDMYRDQEHPTP